LNPNALTTFPHQKKQKKPWASPKTSSTLAPLPYTTGGSTLESSSKKPKTLMMPLHHRLQSSLSKGLDPPDDAKTAESKKWKKKNL
jgi:hypothetical protein